MIQINNLKRALTLGFCFGAVWLVFEGIWRMGWTHIAMAGVGAVVGISVGAINQSPKFYHMRIVWQSIIGVIVTLVIELVSGIFLNMVLGLGIWDYSHMPLNILGQICLSYAILWLPLMPFAFWLNDLLCWSFWRDGFRYSILDNYKDFFKKQDKLVWKNNG